MLLVFAFIIHRFVAFAEGTRLFFVVLAILVLLLPETVALQASMLTASRTSLQKHMRRRSAVQLTATISNEYVGNAINLYICIFHRSRVVNHSS